MEEEYSYIKAMLENDHYVLNQLYKKYFPRIKTMVLKNSGTAHDAFDIFQEALVVIYKKAQQPNFELTSKFYTFLYGVSWNLLRKRFDKISLEPLINVPEEGYNNIDLLEEVLEDEKRYQLYKEKLNELAENCQKIIKLFLKKIKLQEIADMLNYKNQNTVAQKHFKCKKQLIKLIREDERYES